MKSVLGAFTACFALGASLGVTPANAAEAPVAAAATGDGLAEITVTAERKDEPLSRVAITVTVIGADELANAQVTNISDLVKLVPGLQVTPSPLGTPDYSIRGVGFFTFNATSTQPVGVYINEVDIPYTSMTQGLLFDLDRVEVLKGPQGTLYGRNATGGQINLVAAQPTHELSAGGSIEFGNYQTINLGGFISGPVNDTLRLRLAVDSQNRFEGWQQSVSRDDTLGRLHQQSARFIADFSNDSPFSANLMAQYWLLNGDAMAGQATVYLQAPGQAAARASIIANPTNDRQADWDPNSNQPQADVGIFRPAPEVDKNFGSIALKLGYQFSDTVRLASLTSFNRLSSRNVSDISSLQIEGNAEDAVDLINTGSEELRLLGEYDKFSWSVGGYFASDNFDSHGLNYADQNDVVEALRGLSLTVQPGSGYTPYQVERSFGNFDVRADGQSSVKAAFANTDYTFSDHWKVSAGARFTQDEESINECSYDTGTIAGTAVSFSLFYPILIGHPIAALKPFDCDVLSADKTHFVDIVTDKQTENNVAWHVNLNFTPNNDTLFYGSLSRGYKAGSFPLVGTSVETQLLPVQQEELTDYELGTKVALFDHAMQLNASVFYYDYRDKQVPGFVADPVFGTLARIVNIPKSHEAGLEADLAWRLTRGLTLRVAGVYLESKIDDYIGIDELAHATNFAGQSLAYTPHFQGNASLEYQYPLNDRVQLNTRVGVSYQSDSNASLANLEYYNIAGHAVTDALIGVGGRNDKWRVDLYGTNIFDRYYWTGVYSATESVVRYAGMPLQFGIRASTRF